MTNEELIEKMVEISGLINTLIVKSVTEKMRCECPSRDDIFSWKKMDEPRDKKLSNNYLFYNPSWSDYAMGWFNSFEWPFVKAGCIEVQVYPTHYMHIPEVEHD